MEKGFFRRKVDTVLGVDIQDTGIRLIELGHSPAGYSVQSYATQALPPQAVVDSSVLDLDAWGRRCPRHWPARAPRPAKRPWLWRELR